MRHKDDEHSSRDSQKSHVEVRESLYIHEIELPDDSHRKKIERVKESILAMKERTKDTPRHHSTMRCCLQFFELYVSSQRSGFLVLNNN